MTNSIFSSTERHKVVINAITASTVLILLRCITAFLEQDRDLKTVLRSRGARLEKGLTDNLERD